MVKGDDKRVRVLHLLNLSDIGGAERMVLSLLGRLNRERFSAAVACLKGGGPLEAHVRALDLPFHVLPNHPLRAVLDLVSLLKKERVHLLQTHGARAELIGAAAGQAAGVRVISTLHDLYGFDSLAKVWSNRLANPFIERYVSVTERGRRLAVERFAVDPRRIEVIENGVEPPAPVAEELLIELRRSLGVGEGLLVIVVANLRPVKGHLHVLRAVQHMSDDERRRFTFCFIGADQMNGALQRAAVDLGVAEQVVFSGYRSNVAEYLQAADIFLLPSENEGMPMAVLEAMAAGCPVIAANVGGVAEAIDHGRNGLLIEPRSPQAIAEALLKLAADPELRLRLRANAAATAKERFSLDRMTRAFEDLYLRLGTCDSKECVRT